MGNMRSEKQKEVLRMMDEGWEFGWYPGLNATAIIQEGGCGKGGKSIKVNLNTFTSLYHQRLIKCKPNQHQFAFPEIFILTDLGREALKDG